MAGRLNPKLTKRIPANSMPKLVAGSRLDDESQTKSGEDSSSEPPTGRTGSSDYSTTTSGTDETTDDGSSVPLPITTGQLAINPRLHMLHNGNWISRVYVVGRLKAGTGVWDCCGDVNHYSMYCASQEQRDLYKKQVETHTQQTAEAKVLRDQRKDNMQKHVQWSMDRAAAEEGLEDTPSYRIHSTIAQQEKDSFVALASNPDRSFNAPMLAAWLLRHCQEEETVKQGLSLVMTHVEKAEGCVLLQRHDLAGTLYRIQEHFLSWQPEILSMVLKVLRQLLDCNLTRDLVLKPPFNPESQPVNPLTDSVSLAASTSSYSIEHDISVRCSVVVCDVLFRYRKQRREILDPALRCLMQGSRVEAHRTLYFSQHILLYLLHFLREEPLTDADADALHSMLRLLNWAATTQSRMELVYSWNIIPWVAGLMRKFARQSVVLVPALALLHRLAQHLPVAVEASLKYKVLPVVVKCLKALPNDADVQLMALQFIQYLAKTSEGFTQLNELRGAWQEITQGTMIGEELMHTLPGPLQNKGWAVGDAPFRPHHERQGEKARVLAQTALQQVPKSTWTPSSLRDFMGLSMSGQKLAINTEEHTVFFELLSTLDVLPQPGEEREAWFKRLRTFERESEVSLDDMVVTIQEMRRREAMRKKLMAQGIAVGATGAELNMDDPNGDKSKTVSGLGVFTAKPLYVQGKLITTQSLQEADADLDEAFAGNLS